MTSTEEVDRLNALIEGLIPATLHGLARWKAVESFSALGATAGSSEAYICGLRKGSVTLSEAPFGALRIVISDTTGEEVISAHTGSALQFGTMTGLAPVVDDEKLQRLWEVVRERHTRVSDTLDDMIQDIGGTPPR